MKILLSILTSLSVFLAIANGVQISIYPQNVIAGEPAELILRTQAGSPPEFIRMPDIKGVEWLGSGYSTRYQIINGRAEKTSERRYSFIAETTGIFTVPATEVRVGRERYQTRSFTFEVNKARFRSYSSRSGYDKKNGYQKNSNTLQGSGKGEQREDSEITIDDAFFSKIIFPGNKQTFYVGENIPAEIQVYLLAGIKPNLAYPQLSSQKENLIFRSYKDENPQDHRFAPPTTRLAEIDGREYICYTFRTEFRAISPGKVTLTSQTKGELRLPGNASSRSTNHPYFNEFFNSGFFGRIVQHTAKSESPVITIQPLPAPPTGSLDLGLVGTWKIESGLSALETSVGNAVTLTVKIEGNGGLENLKAPELKIDGLRIYTPEISRNPDGKRAEIKYIMIPVKPGTFDIKLNFCIFDTNSGKYKETVLHKPLTATATAGIIPAVKSPNVVDVAMPEPEKKNEPEHDLAGIMYLKRLSGNEAAGNTYSIGTILFFLLIGFATLLFCEIWAYIKKGTNEVSIRRAEAKRQKKKIMEKLKHAQSEQVYNLVPEISDYINNALNLSPGTSMDEIAQSMQKKDPELAQELKQLSAGAWAPGAAVFSEERKQNLMKRLKKVICLAICLLSFAASAEMTQVDAMRAYDKGEFKTAREWYTAQLNHTGATPALLYNIGNCYYQEKEFAKALACYERARMLDPGDSEILRNMELAQRETGLPVLKKVETPADIPSYLMDQLTPGGWCNLAFLGVALGLIALGLRRFFSWKVTVPTALAGLLLLLLGSGMLIAQHQTTYSETRAMIIKQDIPLRALPSITAKTVSDEKLQASEIVQIRESRNDWVRIKAGNAVGWVPATAIAKLNGDKFSVF